MRPKKEKNRLPSNNSFFNSWRQIYSAVLEGNDFNLDVAINDHKKICKFESANSAEERARTILANANRYGGVRYLLDRIDQYQSNMCN